MAAIEELFSLRPGVYSATKDGVRYLLTARGGEPIGPPTDGQQALLERLAAGPATQAELASAAGCPVAEPLARWRAGGWLSITTRSGGRPGYAVRPFRRPPPAPSRPRPDVLVLSRFALLRRDGADLLVESPRAWCDVEIHDPALLAGVLGDEATVRGAAAVPGSLGDRLAYHLWWAGMLVAPADERRVLTTRAWYPHELWFHQRSRDGHRQSVGDGFAATFWLRGEFHPPPDGPPPLSGPSVALPRPDLARLCATDPPLAAVVEDRRSVRTYDDRAPLTVAQLGELLFRCARTVGVSQPDAPVPVRRPYPVGGGLYDLDLYPVVHRVAGLDPGMYRYDPGAHRLAVVCAPNRATRVLLEGARAGAALTSLPQLLLVISARFARSMYKYQQLSYALMLKNVGVLYQQLYLAATAMRLAPCALGSGNADAFAAATGHDPLVESSVGEFIVGSALPCDRAAAGRPGEEPPA